VKKGPAGPRRAGSWDGGGGGGASQPDKTQTPRCGSVTIKSKGLTTDRTVWFRGRTTWGRVKQNRGRKGGRRGGRRRAHEKAVAV